MKRELRTKEELEEIAQAAAKKIHEGAMGVTISVDGADSHISGVSRAGSKAVPVAEIERELKAKYDLKR